MRFRAGVPAEKIVPRVGVQLVSGRYGHTVAFIGSAPVPVVPPHTPRHGDCKYVAEKEKS
jgi:hypothetical protein